MTKLIIGLILWVMAHGQKRFFPRLRRDLEAAAGARITRFFVAVAILAGLVLIVMGYRQSEFIAVYTPMPGIGYLNNVLMFFALFAMGIGPAGGALSAQFRHPMLWGVILWAVAHLLVNGDLSSIIMFGGLGLWALLEIRLINQHEGPWERPLPGNRLNDTKLALATLFLYFLIAGIHWLFNHNPFLGTYG